jgi:hypothetical protein
MNTPEKINLFKLHKSEYVAAKKPVIIETKPAQYLAIDGQGAPGGAVFEDRIGALYGMAFTLKMTRKFAGLGDYTVGKLEALWWGPDDGCFACQKKDKWSWKLMIRTPDFVSEEDLAKARKALIDKGKTPSVNAVRLESIDEGRCVQMLHVGPYESAGETVALMKNHAEANGFTLSGRHHEIYISDPRRIAPEKLKTILRSPLSASK